MELTRGVVAGGAAGAHGGGNGRVWQRGSERSAGDVCDDAVGHVDDVSGACDVTGGRAGRDRNGADTGARTVVAYAWARGERRAVGAGAGFGRADGGQ